MTSEPDWVQEWVEHVNDPANIAKLADGTTPLPTVIASFDGADPGSEGTLIVIPEPFESTDCFIRKAEPGTGYMARWLDEPTS